MNKSNSQITFPIIVFTQNDKNMYGLDYPFLMGDERFLKTAFKNTQIIDSKGLIYNVDSVIKDSGILFWQSIKLMGRIVKVKPIYTKEPEKIELDHFKFRVKTFLDKNPKYFESKGKKEVFLSLLNKTESFSEMIKILM